jgi:arylsulfatase A-like enzyme
LGNHESEKPEGKKLLKEGKEVEYLSISSDKEEGWRWIATAESLDLRHLKGFDKNLRGVVLSTQNSLQFEKLLPDGEIVIDLYIVNPHWPEVIPQLELTFNGKVVENLAITRKKWFRIRKKTALGQYLIEIKFAEENAPAQQKSTVILGQVKISGSSDILLYSLPRQQDKTPPQDNFVFQYYTQAPIPEKKIKPVPPDIRYNYNFKNKYFLFDSGIQPNPYSIKKKIKFDEYSLNSLASPPRSEFALEVKVPPEATLEFGYGILNEFLKKQSDKEIRFQIFLKNSSEEQTLFDQTISWKEHKEIIYKKISLKHYSGQKVKITFLTTEAYSDDEGYKPPPIVPVWVNPLIYHLPEEKQPNVVLISLDTLRPDHLGCYGYQRNTSPGIDSLAEDGVMFVNTFSTTSWTLPGHISMLTSLDCVHHQVYFPLQKMEPGTTTLADVLRDFQFYCAAFTGGGYLSETYGFSKGFDAYQEIRLHGDKAIRFDEAERLAELAVDWVVFNKDKQFFLFLHTYQPHDPYANYSSAGKEFLSQDARWKQIKMETLFENTGRFDTHFTEREKHNIIALYDGEIKYTDTVLVQPILQKLKALGLYDRSLIILTSDHGEEFYEHESWLHDHSIYDEAIKIPLIVKFPDSLHKGKRFENIVRITDIMPTILDIVGVSFPDNTVDGQSLLPIIKGKEAEHRPYISDLALRNFEIAPTLIAANKGQFKLILNKEIVSPFIKQAAMEFNGSNIELYDTEKDPGETENLAADISYRDLCIELIQKITDIYERVESWKKEKDEVTLDQSLRERLKALGYIK